MVRCSPTAQASVVFDALPAKDSQRYARAGGRTRPCRRRTTSAAAGADPAGRTLWGAPSWRPSRCCSRSARCVTAAIRLSPRGRLSCKSTGYATGVSAPDLVAAKLAHAKVRHQSVGGASGRPRDQIDNHGVARCRGCSAQACGMSGSSDPEAAMQLRSITELMGESASAQTLPHGSL